MKKSYNNLSSSLIAKKLSNSLVAVALLTVFILSSVKVEASEINGSNVLRIINTEREGNHLKPLLIDPDLERAATLKSRDMINRNYFEHYAFGLTPWDFIKNSGYDFSLAGENLAMDFATSEGMVNAWMNSPAHRANILNPDFQDIGIGIVKGAYKENGVSNETTMVANLFGSKKSKFEIYLDNILKRIINLF